MKQKLPVLPLRDVVLFPHLSMPLFVGRPRSLAAIESARVSGLPILLVTQKESEVQEPTFGDLYSVGVVATIRSRTQLPDGNCRILVECTERAKLLSPVQSDQFLEVEVDLIPNQTDFTSTERMIVSTIREAVLEYFKAVNRKPDEILKLIEAIQEPDRLVDLIASQLPFRIPDKQDLLSTTIISERLEKLAMILMRETESAQLDQKIRKRVQSQIEKSHREHYLHEQMAAIQKELGDEGDPKSDLKDLEEKLKNKPLSDQARERANRELKRLKTLNSNSPEVGMIRNYLDLIADLPWNHYSEDEKDFSETSRKLDEDHFGLKDVKERILEFLIVLSRVERPKSPILSLVGPPGVGKTSIARSVARAMGRKFEKISLGGMRDEAELRGHRRTYIGALPGKIIAALKKAGTSNPVILLDEVDKLGRDFRGDPESALLEILDPEQNQFFMDHYLDLEYDLSKVLFIATANVGDSISGPLRDRMELIRIEGYTDHEKIEIAKGYLIPRELEAHGLKSEEISFEESALLRIIRSYTRESGARQLQREIAKVMRKFLRKSSLDPRSDKTLVVRELNLEDYLGPPKFRAQTIEPEFEIGSATGLAWTPTGGDVLTIEVSVYPGKGNLQITGQLGDVMQESVKAALSYARSRIPEALVSKTYFAEHDIHVHVPEGAIQKDGPSAGITLATALLSALLKSPSTRSIGMTGEITLRGNVLPIGGLKEKLLAARRYRLHTVLFPKDNERDLKELDQELTSGLKLIPVKHMDEVIPLVFKEQIEGLMLTPNKRAGSSAATPFEAPH